MPPRPTAAELQAAEGKTIPDVIGPGLRVLFCGINPGLYSGFTGRHFARPGNRFWPALFASGFTDRLLRPDEQRELLRFGCGVTNLVRRATATAAELSAEELKAGGERLVRKARKFAPQVVAILGVTAYRAAFRQPKAELGRQLEIWGHSLVWVLPNPSGLNAHYTPSDLARVFREFRESIPAADE